MSFHSQANIAQSYALVVSADQVKHGFKHAFTQLSYELPLYGKHSSPPLQYADWWSLVIEKTFEHTDVASSGHYTQIAEKMWHFC